MGFKRIWPYPPMPSRRQSENGTSKDKHEAIQRDSRSAKPNDAPQLRDRLAEWLGRWGADLLLTAGALLVSVGVGWIYPPAGLIAGGVLLLIGGWLLAEGGW